MSYARGARVSTNSPRGRVGNRIPRGFIVAAEEAIPPPVGGDNFARTPIYRRFGRALKLAARPPPFDIYSRPAATLAGAKGAAFKPSMPG